MSVVVINNGWVVQTEEHWIVDFLTWRPKVKVMASLFNKLA